MQTKAITIRAVRFIAAILFYAVFLAGTIKGASFTVSNSVIYKDGKPFPIIADANFGEALQGSSNYLSYWKQTGGTVHMTTLNDNEIETAGRAGLYSIVNLGIFSYMTGEYLRMHPQAAMLGPTGSPLTYYPCFLDEGLRTYLTDELHSIAGHFKDNPWFCGYFLQDEFSYPAGGDYNSKAIDVFRDKMMEQYGTIQALNAAWATNYLTRAQIQPPPASPYTYPPGMPSIVTPGRQVADWQWFRRWAYLDFLRVVSQAIKEVDPNHLVIHSMDWWSGNLNPTAWWDVPNYVDVLCRHGIGYTLPYNFLLIRQIAEWSGKAGMALCMPPGFCSSFNEFRTLFDSARSGQSYVCPAGPGASVSYKGSADSDDNYRRRDPEYTTAKGIIQLGKVLDDNYLTSKRRSAKVGFFLGERTACIIGSINYVATGILNLLEDINVDYDILSEYNCEPLGRYDALIIGPGIELASNDLVNKINNFKAAGKSLILLPYAFRRNESNEIVSVSRFPLNQRYTNIVNGYYINNITVNGRVTPLYPYYYYTYDTLSYVSVNTGDTVVARTTTGIPCGVITENGKVLILGWEIGWAYAGGSSFVGMTDDYGGTADTGTKGNLFKSIYATNLNSLLTHDTCVALTPQKEVAYLIRDFLASANIAPCVRVNGYEAPGAIDAESFIITNSTASNILIGIANRLVKPGQSIQTLGWDMDKKQTGVWPQDYHIPITNAGVAVVIPGDFSGQLWAYQMPNTEVNGISISAMPKRYAVNVVTNNGQRESQFTIPVIYDWRALLLTRSLNQPLMGIQLSDRRIFGGQSCTATVSILNSTDHPLTGNLSLKDVHGLGTPTNTFSFNQLAPGAETNAVISITVNPSARSGYYSLQAVADFAGTNASSVDVELYVSYDSTVVNWPLNEGSNCIISDLSGNLNHGALHLGAGGNTNPVNAWVDGWIKKAVHFDGADDFIEHSGDNIAGGLSSISIEAWIYPEKDNLNIIKTDGDAILLHAHTTAGAGFCLKGADGTASGYINYKPGAIKLGKWNYIVGTWDGNKTRLYVNCELQGERDFNGGASGKLKGGAYFQAGSSYGSEQAFQGNIDEIKVYAKALSADAIRKNYDTANMVGVWSFDEGSGGIAKDTSGNGFDGTLLNMNTNTCWTNGVTGTARAALRFNGTTNNCVDCGDNPKMKGMPELTVEAWVKGNTYKPYAGILSKWAYNYQQHYNLYFQGGSSTKLGKFSFCVSQQLTNGASDTIQSQANLDLNKWYHIAGVFKGGQYLKLYVNGVLNTNKSTTIAGIASGALPTWIGQYACYPFDGLIDEVKVYSKALSDEEIQNDYLAGNKVGEWKFNEGSGTTAKDTSGYGFDGTLNNMNTDTCWTNGVSGTALKFNGVDDYVNCGDDPKSTGMSELTVEAWIKGNSYKPYAGILSKYVWHSQQYYSLGYFQGGSSTKLGNFQFVVSQQLTSGDDIIQSQANLDLNKWYHIVGVFKGGEYLKLYVNGVLNTTKSTTVTRIPKGTWPTSIGRYACYPFDGLIDEVKVYSKALSDDEIRQDYLAGDKVGEWKFNEGSGGTAKDTSGYGFNGTLNNMNTDTCWTNGVSGTALKFNGVDDYVNCGDNPKMKGMPELTVEAWVKGNTYKPYAGILSKWLYNSQNHYLLGYFENGSSTKLGKFSFFVSQQLTNGASDGIQSQTSLDLNMWYHIAGVFKGGQYLKLYVNGVLNTNKSTTVSQIANGALPTWIGQYGNYPFDGLIDEVKVYSKAFSDEDIRRDYLAGVKVGEWKFDERSGGIAKDTSGYGYDGTLLNMDTNKCWTDGASGTALKFDGTNDYVNCGDNPKMKGMPELTIEAWVKGNSYKQYAGILSKWDWNSQQHYALGYFLNGSSTKLGNFTFCVSQKLTNGASDTIQSQANLDLNKWYHIAGVFKGGQYLKLYVNGVLNTNKSTTVSQIANGALPTWIGQYACYPFDGLIDEVKVYSKALSDEEIRQDFNEGGGTNVSDGGNSTNTPPSPPSPGGGGTTNIYSVFAADFDGDAKADPVLYNQTNGDWAVKLSASDYALTNLSAYLGGPGYTALAADFDGDALADPCVYKAATSNWLVRLSSAGYGITNLADVLGGSNPGGTNYVALAGDFDGDAKADPGVYQAATGTWIMRLSAFDYLTVAQYNYLGGKGYTAMVVDFDGDGLVDPAVYYDYTGYWAMLLSAGEYIPALLDSTFGGAGWIALAADFDGDHYADPAIFQLSTGAWLIKLSSVDYIIVDPFF